MKKNVMKVVAAALICVFLVGCGVSNLEAVMNSAAGKAEVEKVRTELLEQFGDVYSDYALECTENDLVYKYYYTADYDAEMLAQIKEALAADTSWSSTIAGVKDEIEKSSKIRPTSVTFAYYSASGEEVFSVTE
ncbi:MAG: DUF4854 domain-containing protein [Lachnospiraceae bacterium]|nr:DUF4854 domain-containing protein [Lachnospiraceae bacterium]